MQLAFSRRIKNKRDRIGNALCLQAAGIEAGGLLLGQPINAMDSLPDGSFRFDLLPSGTYMLRAGPGEITIQLQDTDIADAIIDLHSRAGHTRE